LGLVLWSTEVLTEGLPLLFGTIPFSIVIFIVWTFSANKHMDRWITVMCCCSNSCCQTSVMLLAAFAFQRTTREQEHWAAETQNSGLHNCWRGLPTDQTAVL